MTQRHVVDNDVRRFALNADCYRTFGFAVVRCKRIEATALPERCRAVDCRALANAGGCDQLNMTGLVAVHQHAMLGVPLHGAPGRGIRDHCRPRSAPSAPSNGSRATSCSMIGPFVEIGSDVVRGGADQFDAAPVRR